MDREYLKDYEQKEKAEFERLVKKKIKNDTFSFEKDKYPPDERFVNLQDPVAVASLEAAHIGNLWAQIPLCGSLVVFLPAFPQSLFEESLFKVSEIPKIIDFVKETGRLQVALRDMRARLFLGAESTSLF